LEPSVVVDADGSFLAVESARLMRLEPST